MKPSLTLCAACSLGATLVALSSCAAPSGGSGNKTSLSSDTKDAPFVNSLGMKFVPVPGTKILMCTTETTVAQFQAAGMGYQAPTFVQGSNHPAVNVSWNDAKAYCEWLSKRDGRKYCLPTDAEWSAAVGDSSYPWGNSWPPPNNCGNYAGQELRGCTAAELAFFLKGSGIISGFSDRHKFTAPVGSYPANGYGLHDLGGNVMEWCEDKWQLDPSFRVLRGGSFISSWINSGGGRGDLATSHRYGGPPDGRFFYNFGFRCVVVK